LVRIAAQRFTEQKAASPDPLPGCGKTDSVGDTQPPSLTPVAIFIHSHFQGHPLLIIIISEKKVSSRIEVSKPLSINGLGGYQNLTLRGSDWYASHIQREINEL
jgi:hypothetical protein